jgi:predicted deacylase
MARREPFEFAGRSVAPGQRAEIELRIPDLYTNNPLTCPVAVIHGRRDGPTVFLSGAIHGDEINGVEIIRRVLKLKAIDRIAGTLIAVPVVNILGFIAQTRYLPDRRDLNRSFPGSESGSLAARTAHLFMTQIVERCTHGIDLHTAAIHRDNFPQVRAALENPEVKRMARAFHAPVIIDSGLAEGTLRAAASERGIPMIVYEAGEALRFDEVAIRAGVTGVTSVLRELGMLKARKTSARSRTTIAGQSRWVRAEKSGILRASKALGQRVTEGEPLGVISDPFGSAEEEVISPMEGLIVGRTNIPLVNEGEALFHIASFKDSETVYGHVEEFQQALDPATDDKPSVELPIV